VTPDVLRSGNGRPSSPVARIASALEMELRLTSRRLENLFVTLVLPVVLLLFFAALPVLPAAATAVPGAARSTRSSQRSSRLRSSRPGWSTSSGWVDRR